MTKADAAAVLGVAATAQPSEARERFQMLSSDLEARFKAAPTPTLQQDLQKRIDRLDMAIRVFNGDERTIEKRRLPVAQILLTLALCLAVGASLVLGRALSKARQAGPAREPESASQKGPARQAVLTTMTSAGTIHLVEMYGDDGGYRFVPSEITIRSGDSVRFVVVNGAPHNVAFDAEGFEAGPMLLAPGNEYIVGFTDAQAGRYSFHCSAHQAMGMKGLITVL